MASNPDPATLSPQPCTTTTMQESTETDLKPLPTDAQSKFSPSDSPKSPKDAPPSIQETAQSLTDQALEFLSTASNETLSACLLGIGASTYFILGRFGLVIIGVVGGVVLHATWEGSSHGSKAEAEAEEQRKREVGLDVAKRAMSWRDKDEDVALLKKVEVVRGRKLDFDDFRPETKAALDELADATIRDYVQ